MSVERELAPYLCGRWDRLGGYLRLWFDGPGIAWRWQVQRLRITLLAAS